MTEFTRGCDYIHPHGRVRNAIAKVGYSLEAADGIAFTLANGQTYANFRDIVVRSREGIVSDSAKEMLDKKYSSQEGIMPWRDIIPVAADAVLFDEKLVTTTTDILALVRKGRTIAQDVEQEFTLRNRLLNTRAHGSFAGILLNSSGKLSSENPRLTPAQEAACIDAILGSVYRVGRRRLEGTEQGLFTRAEFQDAVRWVRPWKEYVVFNSPK